jgi:hypothetical protein
VRVRIVSEDFDAEVAGTTQRDFLEVTVWRGGAPALDEPLDVSAWSRTGMRRGR